jgi:hypothetical protein
MRSHASLVVAMCAVLAVSTAWATQSAARHHHRHGCHVTHPAPAPTSGRLVPAPPGRFYSPFAPYAHPGEGDNDGLSRDPDECMKGCIGGNPG